MKYDILEPYKEFLYDQLTANTARKYYSCMVKLLQGVDINRVEELSLEYLQKELMRRFKTKNEFSAAKNALRLFGECYPQLQMPATEYFKEESLKKRNYTKKPGKVIHLKTTMHKINQIENPKLKYAYRLAVISGLRVSELADLRPSDVTFAEGRIVVTVQNGKGGHGGVITCRQDPYLYDRLRKYVSKVQATQGEKLFYSEATMSKEAGRLGLECHDLRRIYAILSRRELKAVMPAAQADREVQRNMRHVRFSTTKRYLYNRKLRMD